VVLRPLAGETVVERSDCLAPLLRRAALLMQCCLIG
jgi:hypothetical protein